MRRGFNLGDGAAAYEDFRRFLALFEAGDAPTGTGPGLGSGAPLSG